MLCVTFLFTFYVLRTMWFSLQFYFREGEHAPLHVGHPRKARWYLVFVSDTRRGVRISYQLRMTYETRTNAKMRMDLVWRRWVDAPVGAWSLLNGFVEFPSGNELSKSQEAFSDFPRRRHDKVVRKQKSEAALVAQFDGQGILDLCRVVHPVRGRTCRRSWSSDEMAQGKFDFYILGRMRSRVI